MHLPTDVAVAQDGTVFMADGVNDRVVAFAPDGTWRGDIRLVGTTPLARPMGLAADRERNLWIADTGNHRVVVRAPDGALVRQIPVTVEGPQPAELTDVAPSPAGAAFWLADNRNHRLLRYEPRNETFVSVGEPGDALGQFQHPFLIAAAADGAVAVADVINARVQVVDAEGKANAQAGRYGVGMGELYRPKGVAFDAAGRIWVSDGTLGVLQVFAVDGRFLDVLRDADGVPLRLRSPMGMVFDRDGFLYVVELLSGGVAKLRISIDGGRAVAGASPASAAPEPAQPQTCTVCHLEWMPLPQENARRLVSLRVGPPDDPAVSRAESCLSCHDGSVVDSRRTVWLEHGHQSGKRPPADMPIPADLPLVAGSLSCRTCHAAHGRATEPQTMRNAVGLRARHEPAELCVRCHTGVTGKPAEGFHPVKDFLAEAPLPDVGSELQKQIETGRGCLACHTAHGDGRRGSLRAEPGKPQGVGPAMSAATLCASCHEQGDAEPEPGLSVHPMEGKLTRQMVAPRAAGGAPTAGTVLDCTSCHKLHGGRQEHYLLAEPLTDSALCVRCHEAQGSVRGSPHDLRRTAPEQTNLLGFATQTGGPCSACHTVHSAAREPFVAPFDPAGSCLTCHRAGSVAPSAPPVRHPGVPMTDAWSAEHPGSMPLLDAAGRHSMTGTVGCLTCHAPHGRAAEGASRATESTVDAFALVRASKPMIRSYLGPNLCSGCHRFEGLSRFLYFHRISR
ncbi:MAG: hypothetical protein HY763_10840 [Planctomycetes bacterium]|nr:hypothetical protein [Planctomycetota bacterium]